jgi:hypothetical protein
VRAVYTVLAVAEWNGVRERETSTRRNNSVFEKTVLPHISNTRKGIFLEGRQILLVSIISKPARNGL